MSANDHFGLDFGGSNVRVATYRRHSGLALTLDQHGHKLPTPAFVAFTPQGPLIGAAAKQQGASNPTNTLFDFKRMIGGAQAIGALDHSLWPSQPRVEPTGLRYDVESEHEPSTWLPADLAALMFAQMRVDVQRHGRFPPQKVVLTVPTAFTHEQRQKLRFAASSVGLHVLRVESDISAAAALLGMGKQNCSDDSTSLIVDCGGGSTSAGVVSRQNGISILRSSGGIGRLGGADFTARLVQHLFDGLPAEQRAAVIENPAARWQLLQLAENAKLGLSYHEHEGVQRLNLLPGFHLDTQITRARFEQLCDDLFGEVVKLVLQTVEEADPSCMPLTEILLLGGSFEIPRLRHLLLQHFPDVSTKPSFTTSIQLREVVAFGAALIAAECCGEPAVATQLTPLLRTTRKTIGIAVEPQDGVQGPSAEKVPRLEEEEPVRVLPSRADPRLQLFPLIAKGSMYPINGIANFIATSSEVYVTVFLGDHEDLGQNEQVDYLHIKEIKGRAHVRLVYELRVDGRLELTAEVEGRPEVLVHSCNHMA